MQRMWRLERDSIGEVKVPSDVYWGAQTQRAVENFPISGITLPPVFFYSMAYIKKACAIANCEVRAITEEKADAIARACDRVIQGEFDNQFVVDVYQAGAGTSSHMNINEVLANIATEILGGEKGSYTVHPNDDVNSGQSTNDVFPTAMRISSLLELRKLEEALKELWETFDEKASEFSCVVKAGRTHLQDATPLTLGQEFSGYAAILRKCADRISHCSEELLELGIGGSAVGTGLNTRPGFRERVVDLLREFLGLEFYPSENLFEAMQSQAPILTLSSSLRELALELSKIADDIRLLSSGPNTGLRELVLPAVQPGSSMMPGKVNPVMAEMLNMVCYAVAGNDTTIAFAEQAGQLELNVMMPVMAYKILDSIEILSNGIALFTQRCVRGINVDAERCRQYFDRTIALVTALSPYLGYGESAQIARESLRTGKSVKELVLEKGLLPREYLDQIFSKENLIP